MVSSTSDSLAVASPTATNPDARSVYTSMDLVKSSPSQALSKEGSLVDEEKHEVPQVEKTTVVPQASNIVDWDGPEDPGNPINFSIFIKFTNVGIVSALTFITPLAPSMFAPGVPQLMEEFHSSSTLLTGFVVSVYVLGFAIRPLILAPAPELLGRAIIYHVCNIGFTVLTVACAVSTNLGMLITFRFFQGCFGSAPVTNGEFHCFLPFRCLLVHIRLLMCQLQQEEAQLRISSFRKNVEVSSPSIPSALCWDPSSAPWQEGI
jgi:hypothetical protein